MALDARRRQKKAEKRRAKERVKRKELARRKASDDIGHRLTRVAAAPILHCCTTQDLWDQGIAQVLISRELANGQVAFAVFLVDRYCLGVKNGFGDIGLRSEYFDKVYEPLAARSDLVNLKPAAARKLVEGAVEYARDLGLSPHPDYDRARHIFGDINPAESDRDFEFGKESKPLFIAGPRDSPGRCHSIVEILSERCGPGGFDYIVHIPSGSLLNGDILHLAHAVGDEDDFEDDPDDVIEGSVAESPPRQD